MLAITETWLSERDSDTELAIDSFGSPVRLDRDAAATGMSRRGGVCLYVNQRYCKNVIVRVRLCTKDIELLCVSLRPPYLPREFPQIFVMVVYIHPRANADNASETILQSTQKLQAISPDAPVLILGDLLSALPDSTKLWTCVMGPSKEHIKLFPFPHLGGPTIIAFSLSHHTALHCRGEKRSPSRVKVWTDESKLSLQGCYECTDWEMFKQSCPNIDNLADVVSC